MKKMNHADYVRDLSRIDREYWTVLSTIKAYEASGRKSVDINLSIRNAIHAYDRRVEDLMADTNIWLDQEVSSTTRAGQFPFPNKVNFQNALQAWNVESRNESTDTCVTFGDEITQAEIKGFGSMSSPNRID